MAKVVFKTLNGMASIECEAQSPKDAFKKLAILQEMCGETECGCCHSKNIAYRVRQAENNQGAKVEYYEMKCLEQACGATLSFGQHVETPTLFAKRWDKESKQPIPNNGWVVYVPRGGGDHHNQGYQQQQPPQQRQQQPQQGYPQQGGRQPQQGGWGAPPQQQMGPPPGQGDDIPF